MRLNIEIVYLDTNRSRAILTTTNLFAKLMESNEFLLIRSNFTILRQYIILRFVTKNKLNFQPSENTRKIVRLRFYRRSVFKRMFI